MLGGDGRPDVTSELACPTLPVGRDPAAAGVEGLGGEAENAERGPGTPRGS